jgi:hypothetical protein
MHSRTGPSVRQVLEPSPCQQVRSLEGPLSEIASIFRASLWAPSQKQRAEGEDRFFRRPDNFAETARIGNDDLRRVRVRGTIQLVRRNIAGLDDIIERIRNQWQVGGKPPPET